MHWLHGYTLYTHAMDGTTLYMCTSCSRPLIGVYMLINLSIAVNDNTRYCSTYQSLSLHTDESGWLVNVSRSCPVVLLVASRRLGGGDQPRTTLLQSYALPLKHTSRQSYPAGSKVAPGYHYQEYRSPCLVYPSQLP